MDIDLSTDPGSMPRIARFIDSIIRPETLSRSRLEMALMSPVAASMRTTVPQLARVFSIISLRAVSTMSCKVMSIVVISVRPLTALTSTQLVILCVNGTFLHTPGVPYSRLSRAYSRPE
ncbi:unknown [Prevotella sp. CAG:873]|nr:unknown [Prevotella sp. CAG:873]